MNRVVSYTEASQMDELELAEVNVALNIYIEQMNKKR